MAGGSISVRWVIEGLLTHFFSPDKPSFAPEDVVWFLELANHQKQWCCNTTDQVENPVAVSYHRH